MEKKLQIELNAIENDEIRWALKCRIGEIDEILKIEDLSEQTKAYYQQIKEKLERTIERLKKQFYELTDIRPYI